MDTATLTQAREAIATIEMMYERFENFTFDDFVDEALPTAELIEKLIATMDDGELKAEAAQSAGFLRFMAAESDRFSMGELALNLTEAATLISRLT